MADNNPRELRHETSDIKVLIDDWECDVVNVSGSGILLRSEFLVFEGGNEIQFTIIFPTKTRDANIVMNGVIVRAGKDEFAIQNVSPAITWQRLLKKYVSERADLTD